MMIVSLNIRNFRGIRSLNIECGEGYNVFVGENGAGKSTVINAVKILLSWLVARIKNAKGRGIAISEDDITHGENLCTLEIKLSDGTSWRLSKQRKSDRSKTQTATSLHQMNALADRIAAEAGENAEQCKIPIFAAYDVNRAVADVPLKLQKKHKLQPADVYQQIDGESKFKTFFEWYREREDIDNANFRYEKTYKPDVQLTAVKTAVESVMHNYKNLRVRRNPLALTLEKDGEEFNIKELSDGEKCYFSIVADIARLLAMANPGLGNPLEGEGIILIDEIDLHLHPQWQSRILSSIITIFPNCQFFITTHSPFVVSNIKRGRLSKFVLMQDGSSEEIEDNIYGQEVDNILTGFFNVESLRNPEIEGYLKTVWDSLARGDYKSNNFNHAYTWLQDNLDQSDIEFAHINLEKAKLTKKSK